MTEPRDRLCDMISGYRLTQMIRAAALLGIPDALANAVDAPRERRALTMDMHMHVLFGARERTEAELRQMLGRARFEVERVVPTSPTSTVIARAT